MTSKKNYHIGYIYLSILTRQCRIIAHVMT